MDRSPEPEVTRVAAPPGVCRQFHQTGFWGDRRRGGVAVALAAEGSERKRILHVLL